MYVRVMIFQKGILRKIHCCCIEGGIYNLKKVYSVHYFHPNSTWNKMWIIEFFKKATRFFGFKVSFLPNLIPKGQTIPTRNKPVLGNIA
jgi:hypothetical protein